MARLGLDLGLANFSTVSPGVKRGRIVSLSILKGQAKAMTARRKASLKAQAKATLVVLLLLLLGIASILLKAHARMAISASTLTFNLLQLHLTPQLPRT